MHQFQIWPWKINLQTKCFLERGSIFSLEFLFLSSFRQYYEKFQEKGRIPPLEIMAMKD